VEPETIAVVRATADALADLGHEIIEMQPDLSPLLPGYLPVAHVGLGVIPMSPEQVDLLEVRTRMVWEGAQTDLAVDYLRALNEMHVRSREILCFWDGVDALLTPMLSRPAPPIGEIAADPERAWEDYRNWLCWSWPFNVTGQPSLSIPGGMSALGVPIGIQLVGGQHDEATLLMLGAQLEATRPWRFP
jgi:amidase